MIFPKKSKKTKKNNFSEWILAQLNLEALIRVRVICVSTL